MLAVLLFMLLVPARTSVAETATGETPFFKVSLEKSQESGDMNVILQIFVLMTVLSLAPSILIMLTSFTRIAIVFSLLRQAIGTQQLPPNQVLVGLALFLTFFIMTPVWNSVNQDALQPYLKKDRNRLMH